jgi:hypothetical protein
MQVNENKRKQMKAKLLSFAYVYFFESGLFNGLQLIQIKKSFPSQAVKCVPLSRRRAASIRSG